MGVKAVTSLQEFKDIINNGKVSAFDFWATWCGPCRAISPIFEKLSESIQNVDFYKIDVDEVPDVSEEVGIRAMPTFILFKNGEEVDKVVGANPPALEQLIAKAQTL